MTGSEDSNRYPRRGERLAPRILREFLLQPIDGSSQTVDGPRRLCDLDGAVWKRFSATQIECWAKQVVDRIAACQERKALQQHPAPAVAHGLRLVDLKLENRTRRRLTEEGFEEDLSALGRGTLGEIMQLRAFGPRCLVDLLCALESQRTRKGRRDARSVSANSASSELTRAAEVLWALPEARLAYKEDVRFRRSMAAVDSDARTAADLAARILHRDEDPPDPSFAAQQLRRLAEALVRLPKLTIEQELTEIFAAHGSPRNRQIVAGYYGWEDGQPHTLTEIGDRFGITRERIRQICAKLTRKPKNLPLLLAPVMDRALELIHRLLPCDVTTLASELKSAGLTSLEFNLENIAAAAKLLERTADFRMIAVDVGRLAVRPDQADLVASIADLAKKEVYFHGLSTVRRIERTAASKFPGRDVSELVAQTLPLVRGFAWLDKDAGWFHLDSVGKHGLPKTIDKILSVAGEVSIVQMREAMCRNRRLWQSPPPDHVLLEYCCQSPGVRVVDQRVLADPPRDWRDALTGVERQLVEILKRHGPVIERNAFEDLCVSAGMNRFSFHAFVSWSPVIKQFGHSLYGLLGSTVSRRQMEQMVKQRRLQRGRTRVLDEHGWTDDGKVWLKYRLSKAASTYAVITVPAALKNIVQGRFQLLVPDGRTIGSLATKDGRAWGLGAFLRRQGARIGDRILLTIDLHCHTATIAWLDEDQTAGNGSPRGAAGEAIAH